MPESDSDASVPKPQGAPARPAPPRRSSPPFRPRFTIGLFYLVAFFFLFSFLQVLPALLEVLTSMPPGPAQERAAAEAAQQSVRPLASVALSLGATSLGSYYRLLPGMRVG